MRNRFMKSIGALAVVCMMLAMAAPSFAQASGFAQWRGQSRYSRMMVDRLIRQAENHSDQFVRVFERALDRSRLEGTIREDRLNERAAELERQLNAARAELGRAGSQWEIRSSVSNAIEVGRTINTVMRRRQLTPNAERQWSLLRNDLNRLAAIYNLRQLG